MVIWGKLRWLTNSYLLHLTNSISLTIIYFVHTYIASNLFYVASWHEILYFENIVVLAQYSYRKLLITYLSNLRRRIQWGIYINHVYDSPIPNMSFSNLLHINSSKSSYVQYWWNCKMNPSLWYLLPFSKYPN